LTSLKDIVRRTRQTGPMYQTYELYLRSGPQGEPRFQPLTCPSAVQVMEMVRGLLDADEAIASVEVRQGGQHLFTLER
jgi:hypothetical protein